MYFWGFEHRIRVNPPRSCKMLRRHLHIENIAFIVIIIKDYLLDSFALIQIKICKKKLSKSRTPALAVEESIHSEFFASMVNNKIF